MNITTNQVIVAALISSSIAFIVAVISALVTISSNVISKESDRKLAVLKVLLEAGYKEYEFRTKQDLDEAAMLNKKAKIKSFTEYVIFYKEMSEIFSNDKISDEDIINTLKHNKKLIDTYYVKREEFRPEYHKTDNNNNLTHSTIILGTTYFSPLSRSVTGQV